jgi:hypothetical protein
MSYSNKYHNPVTTDEIDRCLLLINNKFSSCCRAKYAPSYSKEYFYIDKKLFETNSIVYIELSMRNPFTFDDDIRKIINYLGSYFLRYINIKQDSGHFSFCIKSSFIRKINIEAVLED